ncbi:MAG: glycoside hydrolase family 88 protein [Spirochaetaceae bacterium]|jgi:unsaturated rhamnogalacturonyl hydrolase|nr:glycoside hydrolase family 88 protein [Spirochaetaceae bacterium]
MKIETETSSLIDGYIDEILKSGSPLNPIWNQEMIRQNSKPYWNYIDGCMMTAFMNLFDNTGEQKYLDFCDNFINYFIHDDGSILSFKQDEYNLDNIKEGSVLFKLYDYTGKEKYRKAMDTLYSQLLEQPRTSEGNFWHKFIYPNQIWLDGLYMAMPFYLEYEKRYNNKKNYIDIQKQFKNVETLMKDRKTGLYYHAYDSSRKMFWSHKKTGLSSSFWLRAMGWYVMSLVDVLEILDSVEDTDFYDSSSIIFQEFIHSLLPFQDESGMWFQVTDRKGDKRNYLETSGSAIISYAILKAVNLGILPESMSQTGRKAFSGICNEYLYRDETGQMNLGGTCLVAGLGGAQKRDGSFEYYISEPIVENEAKGIAPFLLAYLYL